VPRGGVSFCREVIGDGHRGVAEGDGVPQANAEAEKGLDVVDHSDEQPQAGDEHLADELVVFDIMRGGAMADVVGDDDLEVGSESIRPLASVRTCYACHAVDDGGEVEVGTADVLLIKSIRRLVRRGRGRGRTATSPFCG